MFVVRIEIDEDRTDYKAFSRKEDAERRYCGALSQTYDGDFISTTLFEVPVTDDARVAVDAVKQGWRASDWLDLVYAFPLVPGFRTQ